jgi:anti-anti-sigma factor
MVIEIVRRWSNEPVTILYLEGIAKLGESADFLMEALEHASKNTRLVVDWTKVDYIDSTGIGEIVRACIAVARKAGKRVFLSNPSERVSRLIEIAASADCFQIVVDEDEALAYLGLQSSVSLGNTLAPPSPTPISHSTRQRPLRVFLCHASNDKTRIRSFADELAVRGIDVWIDEKKLLPGGDWRSNVPSGLLTA